MSIVETCIADAFEPAESLTAADWMTERFYLHDGTAFSEHMVPWITAPQGPCWAYDRPQFRELWLQWAARMGKTNFGLAMLLRRMDLRPGESMMATADETTCKSILSRVWKMIEHSPAFRDSMPPENRRSKHVVRVQNAVCHGAWPRGKSRLADKSIPAGHGNEIDKWVQESTSTEGEPLQRFLKRGAEYADRKFVLESTPGTRGVSRVEAGRLRSTNHRYHVPCPHCGKFQTIEFGEGEGPGCINWDKRPDGGQDRMLARDSAHYVCVYCEGRIEDMHRPSMIRAGVWVPFGCTVDHDKAHEARDLPPDDMTWLRGEPTNWGSEYGSQLSVFYALFHGWGQIAYDFLLRKQHSEDLRQWVNEDKAETWEVNIRKESWEDLGNRMTSDVPRYVVPATFDCVTIGIDKQATEYVYEVTAWAGDMSHTVDYGRLADVATLSQLVNAKWTRADKAVLKPSAILIDSGYRPAEVHAFVNACVSKGLPVRACRGNAKSQITGYYLNRQNSQRSASPGEWITYVDSYSTQDWIDQHLKNGQGTLFSAPLSEHQAYLQELLNEGLVQSLDNHNQSRETWTRLDPLMPNDYRDCKRYSFVAHLLAGRSASVQQQRPTSSAPQKNSRLIERPGGWLKGLG